MREGEGEEEEDRGGLGGRGREWVRSEGCSRSSLLPGRSPFLPHPHFSSASCEREEVEPADYASFMFFGRPFAVGG